MQTLKYPCGLLYTRLAMSVHENVETADAGMYDEKGRTYFPDSVKDALDLEKGDKVKYIISDGEVRVVRKE